jgi:dihydroorotase
MNLLIKSATIVDASSPHNGKVKDVLIENGIITAIKSKITAADTIKIVKSKNLHLSAGWFDMQVDFCDPGFEHKEDLASGIKSAVSGGFTAVAVVPSTNPPIATKSDVQYIKNSTKGAIVDVYPIGALSAKREGKDISEMYDMHLAGAIAFSDDKKAISDAGLLTRALLYTKHFKSLIITHCDDVTISQGGYMNEGITSTMIGLKEIPSLAEELMIARNIFIAEYTDSPIHIANVSTKKGVALIKEAKAKGLKITASVNAYNLALTDSVLTSFDSNYKLNPPLRTKEDIEALLKGIATKTIDVITSDHRPQEIESKALEFDNASFGMIGLETCFALVNSHKGKLPLESIVQALAFNPRAILQVAQPEIEEGVLANITLFDPELEWTLEKKDIKSKSKNTPFINTKFTGKVIAVVNNKQVWVG